MQVCQGKQVAYKKALTSTAQVPKGIIMFTCLIAATSVKKNQKEALARAMSLGVGSLLNMSGMFPLAGREIFAKRAAKRPKSVEEALEADMAAIAGDMDKAIGK